MTSCCFPSSLSCFRSCSAPCWSWPKGRKKTSFESLLLSTISSRHSPPNTPLLALHYRIQCTQNREVEKGQTLPNQDISNQIVVENGISYRRDQNMEERESLLWSDIHYQMKLGFSWNWRNMEAIFRLSYRYQYSIVQSTCLPLQQDLESNRTHQSKILKFKCCQFQLIIMANSPNVFYKVLKLSLVSLWGFCCHLA